MASTKNKNLRILALHGHRQSGEIFNKKAGALRKILAACGVSFIHCPTAPHKLNEPNENGEEVFSWFNWEPADKWNEPSAYHGVEESITFLKQQFIDHGPFDGVLGFSQGGIMLGMLTGMRTQKFKSKVYDASSDNPIAFDFAIFCATFAPLVPEYFRHLMLSNKCAPLATLHIWGTADPLVSNEMSKRLAAEYETQAKSTPSEDAESTNGLRIYPTTVQYLEHSGGHFVPTNAASKPVYKQFFDSLSIPAEP